MLHIGQFRTLVIRPVLETLRLDGEAAEQLILGTALQESGLRYLKQLGDGPALGVFQMEPRTHDDIWLNFLAFKPELAERVKSLVAAPISEALAGNLWYACAMCRIHYRRVPRPLPAAGDIEAQAAYWKVYYNSSRGKGRVSEYIDNWTRYMGNR